MPEWAIVLSNELRTESPAIRSAGSVFPRRLKPPPRFLQTIILELKPRTPVFTLAIERAECKAKCFPASARFRPGLAVASPDRAPVDRPARPPGSRHRPRMLSQHRHSSSFVGPSITLAWSIVEYGYRY